MSRLEPAFENKLRQAVTEAAEHHFVGKRDNLVFRLVDLVHEHLREYGDRNQYNVEPVIESLQQPQITVTDGRIDVHLEWDHPFAHFADTGTDPHEVEGDPLSFVWEEPVPPWVRETFEREGDGYRVFLNRVFVAGIPEGRVFRDAFIEWRAEVRD